MKLLKESEDITKDFVLRIGNSRGSIKQKIQMLIKIRRDNPDDRDIQNLCNILLTKLYDLKYAGNTTVDSKDQLNRMAVNESKNSLKESVDWDYFDKFKPINDKYMPRYGEGETMASQIVTAVNKLIYKWYNDGDVFDNTHALEGWANDLSDYANWLYKYVPETKNTLDIIEEIKYDSGYEELLQLLADLTLKEEFLDVYNKPKQGSIYNCNGPFRYKEYNEYDED